MIDDEKWEFIVRNLKRIETNDNEYSDLMSNLGIDPESKLYSYFISTQTSLIKSLQKLCGDEHNTIDWFIYETEFGLKNMEAGLKEDMRTIKTYEDLRWLIEVTNK